MCCLHAVGASAATISLGSYIVIAPDVFVVPVTIADGAGVAAWQFDLSYDPLDVQVDTACDPFSGNPYCSLITGPVTEGSVGAGAGATVGKLIASRSMKGGLGSASITWPNGL